MVRPARARGKARFVFFFNDTATTEIYTLSLHDALPIYKRSSRLARRHTATVTSHAMRGTGMARSSLAQADGLRPRSEEHTSELQSRQYLVCRLLLEKKNKTQIAVSH